MQIHPAVIMNISEHHTRVYAIRQQAEIVIGAILGKRIDNNVEMVDSFELRFTTDSHTDIGSFVIDRDYYQKKIPLVKQVNPDLDLIGWYSTSPFIQEPNHREGDVSLHRQISEFIPNPIYIQFDPYKRDKDPKISGSLPLNIYEPVIEIEDGRERVNLTEVNWTIVTEDIEIIGLEHNAKSHVDATSSVAVDNLRTQYTAVKMLKDRIKVMSKFIKDVQSGALPYYEEPIKHISNLTSKFPLMNSPRYVRAYNIKCNDVALNTYLGVLTKGSMCKLYYGVPNLKTRGYPSTHARR